MGLGDVVGPWPPCGSAPKLGSLYKRHIYNTGNTGTGITVNRWVGI